MADDDIIPLRGIQEHIVCIEGIGGVLSAIIHVNELAIWFAKSFALE
jgi:hypothetical protein